MTRPLLACILAVLPCCAAPAQKHVKLSPEVTVTLTSFDAKVQQQINRLSSTTDDVEALALAVQFHSMQEVLNIKDAFINDPDASEYRDSYMEIMLSDAAIHRRIVAAILDDRATANAARN